MHKIIRHSFKSKNHKAKLVKLVNNLIDLYNINLDLISLNCQQLELHYNSR